MKKRSTVLSTMGLVQPITSALPLGARCPLMMLEKIFFIASLFGCVMAITVWWRTWPGVGLGVGVRVRVRVRAWVRVRVSEGLGLGLGLGIGLGLG